MKKVIVLLAFVIVLCGCQKKEEPSYKELMNMKEYVILDVRTKEEYESGHIKEAINIPYDTINENTNLDKNKNIFVYCRSGSRSKMAYDTLKKLGYTVYDLGAFDNIELIKE